MTANMHQTLTSRLAELKDKGAHNFDPVQFRFIESLVERAVDKPIAISIMLEQKALSALNTLQAHFEKARSEASEIVAYVTQTYPDSAESIKALFEHCHFNRVKKFKKKCDCRSDQRKISTLVNYIEQHAFSFIEKEDRVSIDDLLLQQEDEILQSFENQRTETVVNAEKQCSAELKSYHLFKSSLRKHHSDKRITKAINERPENPGPLNSQMLAIRTLSALRNLSPDYLNRFISYLDTLFWLERTG